MRIKWQQYLFLMDIQSDIDLLAAYANKLALGLSMKEHAINERLIDREGRTLYSLNIPGSIKSFRKYTGTGAEFNSREEGSLCNHALAMSKAAIDLGELFAKRTKILIECAFSRNVSRAFSDEDDSLGEANWPYESLRGVDYQLSWNKQRIRKFIVENYRKTPQEIRQLMNSMDLPSKLVKQWILYSQKRERIMKLREEVIKQSLKGTISFIEFKHMARKIYKTRLFRATDNWALNYIRKYRLEDFVTLPQKMTTK